MAAASTKLEPTDAMSQPQASVVASGANQSGSSSSGVDININTSNTDTDNINIADSEQLAAPSSTTGNLMALSVMAEAALQNDSGERSRNSSLIDENEGQLKIAEDQQNSQPDHPSASELMSSRESSPGQRHQIGQLQQQQQQQQQQQHILSDDNTNNNNNNNNSNRADNAMEDSQSMTANGQSEQASGGGGLERRYRPQKYCAVCGDKAIACNFNAVTCESCKAFFRRNAFKETRLKCLFENHCVIDRVTRRFCSKCRLLKCFQIGMKRE